MQPEVFYLMEPMVNDFPDRTHAPQRYVGDFPQLSGQLQERLSNREIEVLRLICKELTNIEIGDQLCLSPRTVETYRQTMMEKVGARNTVGLVLYAVRHGFVQV